MSGEGRSRSGSNHRAESGDRTPLLPPGPATVRRSTSDEQNGIVSPESALNGSPLNGSDTTEPVIDKHTKANQSLPLFRGICTAFALMCLIFVQATNISMLTTTSSEVAFDLNVYEETSWFTSVYLIAMSALGPLYGKLCSIFSPRICIFAASILMAAGSLICAWANSFAVFILGRVVAGMGASGVFLIALIIALQFTGSTQKGIAIGTLNAWYTLGVAIGATAAGALVEIVGWRPLFWMQAPISLSGGTLLLLAIPRNFDAGKKDTVETDCDVWDRVRRIDYLGAVTLSASVVFLLYALSAPKEIPILPIILSVLVGIVFVLIETSLASDPIIPVALMKHRGVMFTCLGTVGYMMARWSVLFYTPIYAIAVRQYSSSVAGSLLIPTNIGFAAGGLVVGWLHIKRQGSFYSPTLVTYALFPITLVALAMMAHREGPPAGFVGVLFLNGFVTGAALNYNLAHLLHLTSKETHYVVTALLVTFRGFAGSFGSSIGGGLFTRTLSSSLNTHFAERGMRRESLVRQLLGSPKLVGQLLGVEREVAVLGYEDGLKMLWLAAALLAVFMVIVQAGAGIKGHEEKQDELEERQALLHSGQATDREEVV